MHTVKMNYRKLPLLSSILAIAIVAVTKACLLPVTAAAQTALADKLPSASDARHQTIPDPQTRKYLLFQLTTADPAILGDPNTPHVGGKMLMDTFADQLVTAIGERGDHVKRQLGMVVGPLSWDLTDDQIRGVIRDAFAVAEEKNLAVGFHIDDSMFWNRRKYLWSDQNNVEWSDWNGMVVLHRIIGFVPNHDELAPPMCYNSPAIIAETTRRARDVIGAEIKQGVDRLKSHGKAYLFAGVIAGWETRMQDDSYPPVYYGYCALHNLGYSASHPPSDMDQALERVVADWIALWAKSLEQSGIPRAKVFMHIAYPGEFSEGLAAHLKQIYQGGVTDPRRDFYKGASPNILGFDTYASPGFSIYGDNLFPSLHKMLASYGNPPWAICEGTNIDLSNAFSNLSSSSTFTTNTQLKPASEYAAGASMEQYLGGAFNHGAVLVNLFGWDRSHADAAFARATMGAPAIRAYQKFLKAEPLSESGGNASPRSSNPLPASPVAAQPSSERMQQFSEKMQIIQGKATTWVQAHPERKPELESLFQQLDTNVQAHNLEQAQQTADAIIRLLQTD